MVMWNSDKIVWGDDWIERAQQISFNLRSQICYHCGKVIAAGQECVPSELKLKRRGQFLAHKRCHDFLWLIHLSEQQYAMVINDPRIKVKNLIKRVGDDQFTLNVRASIKKLKQPKWMRILNAALEWFLKERPGNERGLI